MSPEGEENLLPAKDPGPTKPPEGITASMVGRIQPSGEEINICPF